MHEFWGMHDSNAANLRQIHSTIISQSRGQCQRLWPLLLCQRTDGFECRMLHVPSTSGQHTCLELAHIVSEGTLSFSTGWSKPCDKHARLPANARGACPSCRARTFASPASWKSAISEVDRKAPADTSRCKPGSTISHHQVCARGRRGLC